MSIPARKVTPDAGNLACLLLAALVLRIVVSLVSLGADHPNETYRLLEPMAAGWGFAARLPWEWTQGLLSTLPVRAHLLWLAPNFAAGASAMSLLLDLKVTYAALSLLPVVATWRLLAGSRFALAATAFVAFWPEFIYRSVRLMDYSLEAALLALAVIFAFTFRRATVLAGIALGLAFFVRFQSGLYFIAIFSVVLTERRARALIALTLAYGATIAIFAGIESHLTGAPFLSPFWNYIHFNWVDNGAARFYGVAPWHRYFSEAFKAYGILPFLIFLPAALCAFADERGRRLAVLFFLPFVALSLLGHKEGRFAFGFLWLLVPLAASVPFSREWFSRRWVKASLGTALVVGLAINLERVSRRLFVHAKDVREWSAIGEEIGKMRGLPLIVVRDDPDAVPGAFFLRLHGRLCYEYAFAGKPQEVGSCSASPDAVIARDAATGSWQLTAR